MAILPNGRIVDDIINGANNIFNNVKDGISGINLVGPDGNVIEPTSVTSIGGPYNIPTNFDFSNNPALDELSGALGRLTGQAIDNSLSMVDGTWTGLDIAARNADEIAKKFNGINPSLVASWQNVADFAEKINTRVETLTRNFTEQLKAFIDTTNLHEQEIAQATTSANDLAEEILKSLGL